MNSPEHLFRVMDAAFQRATGTQPDSPSQSFYTFAGQRVRMRIAGREMAPQIIHPFLHLREDAGSGHHQLAIDLWDEAETGIHCQAEAQRDDAQQVNLTAFSPDGRFIAHQLPNTLVCLDLRDARMVGSIAWGEELTIYERAKPLARPLVEWHNAHGVHVIHAGLVSRNGGGVLLAGKSGSGKSTASLTCLRAGFSFASEDYVALERRLDGSFAGHSLYNSTFFEFAHLERFPELAPFIIQGRTPYDDKSALLLYQVYPHQMERTVPIRALAICRVTDAPQSRIRPATKGEALRSLAVSSLLQIPSPGRRGFARLAELIERTPCVWLDLGRDVESIPPTVEEILARVGAQ